MESKMRVTNPGKCLKTRGFCDLCHTADEGLAEKAHTVQKSRKHSFGPFKSGLYRLAKDVRSAFQFSKSRRGVAKEQKRGTNGCRFDAPESQEKQTGPEERSSKKGENGI